VLHNSKGNNSGFSEETGRRVLAAARKLGYRPNRTVRNFYRKRHGAVGLLIGPGAWLPDATLEAISASARRADQTLMMEFGGQSAETVPIFINEDAVDALIVFGDISRQIENRVGVLKLPVVQVNTNRRHEPGTLTYDERGGMRLACEHLKQRGRRRLGLITEPVAGAGHYSVAERFRGMVEACDALGLPAPDVLELAHPWVCSLRASDEEYHAGVEEIMAWLEGDDRPDALVLAKKTYAPPTYDALSRLGLGIGDDVPVVGVNPYDDLDYMVPRLTSVNLDFAELGRTVLAMATEALDDGLEAIEPVTFPMKLIVREST
jgi:DNA-binding LacI/PurR family transcriptional regulator